ncbi:hypothetical protein GCM10028807_58350 [Spirosoma daeguense]
MLVDSFLKLLRFARIYGWARTLNKTMARTRFSLKYSYIPKRRKATVGLIGCGQFAFSTICYFLRKRRGNIFLSAFDIDTDKAVSLGKYYGFRHVADSANDLFDQPELEIVYVASNHASHTDYAVAGLMHSKTVYVEKPVSVSRDQLIRLAKVIRQSSGKLVAGYNRPYAKATHLLRQYVVSDNVAGSFSINYVINGHALPSDHWYRNPDEGTRICGNLSHWIDLTIHLLSWRKLPDWFDIQLAWANSDEPDDNLNVTLTTDLHDLISMQLTARSEPFEGIRESINVQYNNLITHIDDFQKMTLWRGVQKKTWRFSPKDVGHERAVLQPFCQGNRNWAEVELSTLLTLYIRDMALQRKATARFWVQDELARFESDIQSQSTPIPAIDP